MADSGPTPRFAPWLPVGVIWLAGAIPMGMWAGMLVHAVRTAHFLGRWPKHNAPDPKALPLRLQSQRIEAFVIGGFIALVIVIGIAATRRFGWRGRFGAAAIGAAVLLTAWFIISRVDPGGIVRWYLD